MSESGEASKKTLKQARCLFHQAELLRLYCITTLRCHACLAQCAKLGRRVCECLMDFVSYLGPDLAFILQPRLEPFRITTQIQEEAKKLFSVRNFFVLFQQVGRHDSHSGHFLDCDVLDGFVIVDLSSRL